MSLPGIAASASTDAAATVPDDPFAAFTHHQWYLHQARQTVFFAAFSAEALDSERLVDLAADLMARVPDLGALYAAFNGPMPTRETLRAVVSLETVAALDAYPDAWDMSGGDLFVRHDLPMLRVRAVVRRDGADALGRRAALMVVSTHAVLEGADSALLSRSQPVSHETLTPPVRPASPVRRLLRQMAAALVVAPRRVDIAYKSLVLDRARLRRVAARLGLSQRSLLFALVLFALNRGGRGFSRRRISAIYAEIDARRRAGSQGAFFRHFVSEAGFRVGGDFIAFARGVETELDRLETKDSRATQEMLSAVFGAHRTLRRLLPFLYSDRIFRFAGFYHINLSITPPHKLAGPLTAGLVEPVYAGSFHPGLDMCIFVPGRNVVTLNFTVRRRHFPQVAAVSDLLAGLDRRAGA